MSVNELPSPVTPQLIIFDNSQVEFVEGESVGIPLKDEDFVNLQTRETVLLLLKQRFARKSLSERLGEGSHPAGVVLREGLLGFLSNNALISDFAPQGSGPLKKDQVFADPLYEEIAKNIDKNQAEEVVAIFRAIKKASAKMEDSENTTGRAFRRVLGIDHLLTLGDLRSIGQDKLNRITDIGDTRVEVLIEARQIIV
jgi:hypothetical protein